MTLITNPWYMDPGMHGTFSRVHVFQILDKWLHLSECQYTKPHGDTLIGSGKAYLLFPPALIRLFFSRGFNLRAVKDALLYFKRTRLQLVYRPACSSYPRPLVCGRSALLLLQEVRVCELQEGQEVVVDNRFMGLSPYSN